MSDFYTVLRRSLDRADAPDEHQRQEIYDRLRTVIVRKLDAHRPRLKDTEFRTRLVAFDGAVTRIEDEIAASFAAADDVFDELPYERAPAALPDELGAEAEFGDEPEAGEEPIIEEGTFLFDDEEEPEAYVAEPYAEPVAAAYEAEPEEYEPDDAAYQNIEGEAEYEADEYEAGAYEAPIEPPEYGAAAIEAQWSTTPEEAPEFTEREATEAAGPSTMWGSAIDLAWDESTAQWHDPEEPVRPMPPPVVRAPDQPPHPDSEWDRRLQMALVEETVRSRGSAAAPEWVGDEQPDESAFFAEGEWDASAAGYDEVEPPLQKSGGRFGAVTSKLRALSPGRLLRRNRQDQPGRIAAPEPATDVAVQDGRVDPAFEEAPAAAPASVAAQRRTSVRSIAIDERDDAPVDEPARPLRAFRDDVAPQRPQPATVRTTSAEEPAAAGATARAGRQSGIRPVRPTPAPAPSRADGRPQRTPPRPDRPASRETPAADDDVIPLPGPSSRRDLAPPPSETPPSRTGPQRGVRPRLPPPPEEPRAGDPRNLAPAATRAVRYLGSDLDDDGDAPPASDRGDPMFAQAMEQQPQRRRLPPPTQTRNVPPEGRRVVPERHYGGLIFRWGVIGAIVVVVAVAAILILPGVFGGDDGATGTGSEQGIVLFGGADPMVFQTGPDDPVNFDADTAGGIVRVVSSTTGTARATIGPGIAGEVDGRTVRIQLDVRGTPGRAASTLRLAYLRGNALLDWRTVAITGDFAIVDAVWTIPTGVPSQSDALLIAPGVPGDGTAVDIRRIVVEVGVVATP